MNLPGRACSFPRHFYFCSYCMRQMQPCTGNRAHITPMSLPPFSSELLLFLFLAAIVAGFLDTLAGGGGLITLPALILSGIPPLAALGTNKLQGSMGTLTATLVMLRKGRVHWDDVKFLMLSAFIGSLAGTIVVQFINTKLLTLVIPAVLLCTALYFIAAPQPGDKGPLKPRMSNSLYAKTVVPLIGWYDGMFGPGTGSFFALAGVTLRGCHLIDATAVAKTLNFSTNFASLLVFLIAGKVAWIVGIVMICGQFAGAYLGSLCLLRINPKFLRLVIVCMCLAMLGRYAWSLG
jgi:uncharacterized membrane protein YfcA